VQVNERVDLVASVRDAKNEVNRVRLGHRWEAVEDALEREILHFCFIEQAERAFT